MNTQQFYNSIPITQQELFDDRQGRTREYRAGASQSRSLSNSTLNEADERNQNGNQYEALEFKNDIDEKKTTVGRNDIWTTSARSTTRNSVQTHRRRWRFFHDWWLELLGCVFIIGSLIAIFITAYAFQDHPLPEWPSGISINSLIAIYVVILKAAILLILAQGLSHLKWTWFTHARPLSDLAKYDNASRGPLGSIGLVWTLRGRSLVASIGAVIVVAAVVIDPMAQQVIRYWNCPQPVPEPHATIPRTNAYMETGLHMSAGRSTIPVSLQAAINGGVFVPTATLVSYTCSTGNCTFAEPFFTIGFTSSCRDVSDELTFANVTAYYNTSFYQNGSFENPRIVTMNYTMLNSSLPSGLSASYSVYTPNLSSYMSMAFNQSTGVFEIVRGPRTSSPGSYGNLCSSTTRDRSMSNWNCRGYGAARCSIVPGVFSITSDIKSGKLKETIQLQTTNFSFVNAAQSVVDVSCLTDAQKSALSSAGYNLPPPTQPQWLPYNVSVYDNYLNHTLVYQTSSPNISESTSKIVPLQCIYQVSLTSLNSLNYFFTDYLTGTIVGSGSEWTGPTVAQQFYNSSGVTFESVSSMFENITNAMTTHVRQSGWANNSSPAQGQVWHVETCIRVRWPWLAYPAVLAGLTLLFFAVTVVELNRAPVGTGQRWGSSPVALLFCGVDETLAKRVGAMRELGEAGSADDWDTVATKIKVKLSDTDQGWRFVGDDSEDAKVIG